MAPQSFRSPHDPRLARASKRALFLMFLLPAGWVSWGAGAEEPAASTLPENLALRAQASADSEHSGKYAARFAIDGQIPAAGGQDDLGKAWCVRGDTHRHGARFTLEWPQPITIAEIVYHGRTGWFAEECWKDYEVYLDEAGSPALKGQLQMGHGPQRLTLAAPQTARKLSLKFTSSYGGLNPGASEIQVFAVSPPEKALAKFVKLPAGRPELHLFTEVEESPELKSQLQAGRCGFGKLVLIQRHEINPSHVYTYHVEGFSAGGGLFTYALDSSTPPQERELTARSGHLSPLVASPEGQILDCDVSFDAQEILFSWRRKKAEGYHVFAVRADGTNLRQLTDGPWHDYNACWLPDGGIAFLSTRSSRFAYCWISPVGILHRMERDGSRTCRLSANIVNDFTPSVLNDGRIIYSRWEYVDKPAIPIQSLWTIHPDGTGLSGFYGNRVLSPATFMEARSIPGTTKVLCTLTSHNGPARGAIGVIDIAYGNNAQAAITNLTPEVNIGRVDKGDGNAIRGPYENPYPLDGEHFLVSKRGTVLIRDYAGTHQAKVLDPRDGLGFYSPQPLRPRPTPPQLASTLVRAESDRPRSQQGVIARGVPEQTHPRESSDVAATGDGRTPADGEESQEVEWATVVLEDIYRGLEPAVQRGEVKEICVVEEMRKAVRTDVNNRAFGFQFPVISCGATYAGKTVWGYAPVSPDGSACFKVPARRPIYFMALDAQGRAVQRMRTFTHLMPGEQQGCVGCHEPRQQATAPVRQTALAALRAPAGRLPAEPQTLPREPDRLRPPDWGEAVGFDYSAVVQPVLNQHCVRCHSGVRPRGNVDLSEDKTDFFNVSYEYLARGRRRSGEMEWDNPYTSWIPTYNGMEQNILEVTPKAWGSPRSKLTDLLLSGHLETNGQARVQLTPAETRRVLTWIDLNVPYYGTSETAYPEKRGCCQLYPDNLDQVLTEVAHRRCAECHENGKVPRRFWTRITHPELNGFLAAPLAPAAGGSGKCGKITFASTADPDYQAILRTFVPITEQLRSRPRMDMPGAKPAAVDRSCLGSL